MPKEERLLKLFLRIMGTTSLLAMIGVVMPYSWMDASHQWLGLGKMPADAVVGYLARSTSLLYAMHGALLWVASFDVVRYRAIALYIGVAVMAAGVFLLGIDVVEGLPLVWVAGEGPINFVCGALIFLLARRIPSQRDSQPS